MDEPPVSGGHSTTAAVRPLRGLGETDRDERMSATRASIVPRVGCRLSPVGSPTSVGAAESSRVFNLVADTPLPRRKDGRGMWRAWEGETLHRKIFLFPTWIFIQYKLHLYRSLLYNTHLYEVKETFHTKKGQER